MAFNSFAVFLAVGMCITGSLNTLSGKLVNVTRATGLFGYYKFDHPFVQTAAMFTGESLCLVAYSLLYWRAKATNGKIEKASADFPFYIFFFPALFDLTATCIMNVGLVYTYASVFQMMRGSVVIFTGILSYFVLGRKLGPHKILGMTLVLMGLACVGSASVISSNDSASAPNPLLGALLVVAAQVVVAVQMVVEEKAISKYDVPPLLVPGFEGLFGLGMMIFLLIIFYQMPHLNGLTNDDAGNHFENSLDAFEQIRSSYVVTLGLTGYVCSIGFFNYFGASVTKYMNATTRMVLDNIRTIVIWGADLILQWEQFQFMQVIGFILLLLGTAVYNEIIPVPIAYFDYRLTAEYTKLSVQSDNQGGVDGELKTTNHQNNLNQPLMADDIL